MLVCVGTTSCKRPKNDLELEKPWVILSFKQDYKTEFAPTSVEIGDDSVEEALLLVNGEVVGPLRREKDGPRMAIQGSYASLADRSIKLALRFPTPCGAHIDIPLPAYEVRDAEVPGNLATRGTVVIKRGPAELPPATTLWVDDVGHEQAKLSFGSLSVVGNVTDFDKPAAKLAGRRIKLWALNCAAKHTVTMDGVTLGEATPAADTKAFLISTKSNICYQRTVHRYADARDSVGGGSSDYPLPSGQVVPMPWASFDDFLRSSPSGSRTMKRVELDRVDCAALTAKKPAKKAG